MTEPHMFDMPPSGVNFDSRDEVAALIERAMTPAPTLPWVATDDALPSFMAPCLVIASGKLEGIAPYSHSEKRWLGIKNQQVSHWCLLSDVPPPPEATGRKPKGGAKP